MESAAYTSEVIRYPIFEGALHIVRQLYIHGLRGWFFSLGALDWLCYTFNQTI